MLIYLLEHCDENNSTQSTILKLKLFKDIYSEMKLQYSELNDY